MKHTITTSESIPFYDAQWMLVQMKNVEYSVSTTQEEWETVEQIEKAHDEALQRQRAKASNIVPLAILYKKKLNSWIDWLKNKLTKTDLDQLILIYKSIK